MEFFWKQTELRFLCYKTQRKRCGYDYASIYICLFVFIYYMMHIFSELNRFQTGKTPAIRRTTVRETGVSLGIMGDALKPIGPSQHFRINLMVSGSL